MTAAIPRWATDEYHPLIEDYADFCHELGISDRRLRDRLRAARAFLTSHPDLGDWMTRPTGTRLADLRQVRAWPLLSWAGLCGRIRIDLDLLAPRTSAG
jgi:hypothetical protein